MRYGRMLDESLAYTQECLVGKWMRWLLLLVSMIIFPLLYGYLVRIYKGIDPAPDLDPIIDLFIDGVKLLIIYFVYGILPFLTLITLLGGTTLFGGILSAIFMGRPEAGMAFGMAGGIGIGFIAFFIVVILLGVILPIASIRFSRTGSMGEAFNIRAIFLHISTIGWIEYILALIILGLVIGMVQFLLFLIPLLGWILLLLLAPAFYIFSARYMALVYDSAAE